ncbi:MAG: hypothetical protein QGG36_03585 [Pirellulaceae bacterium]|jgi:hypothetical protein|nr:hypothetical protein [Pirellulaceae bacterium]MDP7014860.1 hypothetical protein [Pirellulaceae bacterium]
MADQYFAEEITAVPFRTLRRTFRELMPGWLATPLAAWMRFRGAIGWFPTATYAIGPVGSYRAVDKNDLPPYAAARMAPLLEQLLDLGFKPLLFAIGDTIGSKESAAAILLDLDGSTFACIEWFRIVGADGVEDCAPLELDSYCGAGDEVLTATVPKEHLVMADAFAIQFVDQSYLPTPIAVRRVYEQHKSRIANRGAQVFTAETALAEHEAHSQRRFDWLQQRGMLRPLPATAIPRIKQHKLPP